MPFNIISAESKKMRSLLPLFLSCLGIWVAQAASAQPQALYQNLSASTYSIPASSLGPSMPLIDASNFDNESIFNVTYDLAEPKPIVVCQISEDTINFTNGENGLITVNDPNTGTLDFFQGTESSILLECDDYMTSSGNNVTAGTFRNDGVIRCDSIIDTNLPYGYEFNTIGYLFYPSGLCEVSATNIIIPGNMEMGANGLIQLGGQNVDLSRGVFTIEPVESILQALFVNGPFNRSQYNSPNFLGSGGFGLDTNNDWNPAFDLYNNTGNYVLSSYPDDLVLIGSLAYISILPDNPNNPAETNYTITEVYVENDNPSTPYNVYVDPPEQSYPTSNPLGFEDGAAHVEWVGSYIDPATGNGITNYLYLTDNFLWGASTNVALFNGLPDNFSFATSATPLSLGAPVTAGYQEEFEDSVVTNRYAYMSGEVTSTSAGTNSLNPITTIPGRIQIYATNELNLQNVIISGANYLSIQAPNQFDGSAGAQIEAPFSDINVGVTNGMLSITNLLQSDIPNWSGTVQAWTTRWTNSTAFPGFNVDYRVLLVRSDLSPFTAPYVQNFKSHAPTSLTISDVLNVYGSISLDAQSLTISTNGYGFGATSSEGELNSLINGNIGPAQWPNLRYVTNNGTLSSEDLIIFTNANNYGAVINSGFISDQGLLITATNFVNGGTITNGIGNMTVQSQTTTLTNGSIIAGGKISIGAGSLVTSNTYLQCLSLTLNPTNFLTDSGVSNGNIWVVGRTNGTGGGGFALLNKPAIGDLLGTTITNISPPQNKQVNNIWSGHDYGASNLGYTNNAAVGRLILDVVGNNSLITFTGTGSNSAIYVDSLEFRDSLTNGIYQSYNFTNWLALNPNIVIYFAQAYVNGISIAEKINNASLYSGENGGSISNGVVTPGRLRWVPSYAGYFSSTNFVVNGVTNSYNAALAQSTDIDSDGSGLANAYNPSPFFAPQQINFALSLTNLPPQQALLTWDTVPLATNYVYYTTSLATNKWLLYTSFTSTNVPGSSYPVSVLDTNKLKGTRFYKVTVAPWLTYPY